MTISTRRALRLIVHLSENRTHHHRPLYSEIVHRAHEAGLAGASVFRGVEGFGGSARIHTSRLLSLSEDLPVLVVIVDLEARVRAFLPELKGLDCLVTVEPCEVVRYDDDGSDTEGGGEGDGGGEGGGAGVGDRPGAGVEGVGRYGPNESGQSGTESKNWL